MQRGRKNEEEFYGEGRPSRGKSAVTSAVIRQLIASRKNPKWGQRSTSANNTIHWQIDAVLHGGHGNVFQLKCKYTNRTSAKQFLFDCNKSISGSVKIFDLFGVRICGQWKEHIVGWYLFGSNSNACHIFSPFLGISDKISDGWPWNDDHDHEGQRQVLRHSIANVWISTGDSPPQNFSGCRNIRLINSGRTHIL